MQAVMLLKLSMASHWISIVTIKLKLKRCNFFCFYLFYPKHVVFFVFCYLPAVQPSKDLKQQKQRAQQSARAGLRRRLSRQQHFLSLKAAEEYVSTGRQKTVFFYVPSFCTLYLSLFSLLLGRLIVVLVGSLVCRKKWKKAKTIKEASRQPKRIR